MKVPQFTIVEFPADKSNPNPSFGVIRGITGGELGRRFHYLATKRGERERARLHAAIYAEGYKDGKNYVTSMF